MAKEIPRLQKAVESTLNALDLTPKALRDDGNALDLGALARAAVAAEKATTDAEFTSEEE